MTDNKSDKRKYRVITKEMKNLIISMYDSGEYETKKQIADVLGLKYNTVNALINRVMEERETKRLSEQTQEEEYTDSLMEEWHKLNLWYYKHKRKQKHKTEQTKMSVVKGGACRFE